MKDKTKPVELAHSLMKTVSEWIIDDPRFGGLANYLGNIEIFWSYSIKTACAGHGFIFFNPDFFVSIPEESRKTVMVHEVWHLILKHLERGKGCDPYTHNIAADHVINLGCEADGFTFEGTNPYIDPIYTGKSTEEVYNIIMALPPEKRPKPDGNQPSKEEIEDLIEEALKETGSSNDLDKQKEESDELIKTHGPKPGNKPGNKGILLSMTTKKVIIPDASYHDIFKDYLIDPLSGGKRTFMRQNRRQHGITNQRLRLPGKFPKRGHINRLTHLVYGLDVSGSINKRQAQQFHDSVRTIKDILNPQKLTVLFFDTKIVLQRTFTDKEPYGNIRVNAGGGTNLRPVYDRANTLNPEALVVFTDLRVGIPPKPDYEVIWLVPGMGCPIPKNIYGDIYLIPNQ